MKDKTISYDKILGVVTLQCGDEETSGYINSQSLDTIILYKILERLEKIEDNIIALNNKTRG